MNVQQSSVGPAYSNERDTYFDLFDLTSVLATMRFSSALLGSHVYHIMPDLLYNAWGVMVLVLDKDGDIDWVI
jgi:hypothetical protein